MLKSISQIRLENVEKLMQSTGLSRKDFSEKSSIAYAQFGQYFANNPQKIIGDNIARRIETAFGLEQFWLDQNWGGEVVANVDNISIGGNNTGIIGGTNNTQNNLTQNVSVKDQAELDEISANHYKDMPLLDIDMGVKYALDPDALANLVLNSNQKVLAFIPHTGNTFGIKLPHNIHGITPSTLLQNDILIIEPCVRPRDNDLVLVCLDYNGAKRGIIARLHIGLDNKPMIKHNELDPVSMPINSLICGVVLAVKRHMIDNDNVAVRLDPKWNILDTLVME